MEAQCTVSRSHNRGRRPQLDTFSSNRVGSIEIANALFLAQLESTRVTRARIFCEGSTINIAPPDSNGVYRQKFTEIML